MEHTMFRRAKTHALISYVLHSMAAGIPNAALVEAQHELSLRSSEGPRHHPRSFSGVRKVQRAARKRRNQLRHKAACKGRRS